MKTQTIIYHNDYPITDAALLNYLGASQVIIKKGGYFIDYTKNPNGQLKLNLITQIAQRTTDQNLTFIGFDAQTNNHFEYTVQPEYVNGVAHYITINYQKPKAMHSHSHLMIQLYKLCTALLFLARQLMR